MKHHLAVLGALCWLGCGAEGPIVSTGGGGTEASSAGSSGAGGAGEPGSGGTEGGAPDEMESDVIKVDEGDFSVGELPVTGNDAELPQIVRLTGPAAVTNGGTALLQVELSVPVASPTFVVGLRGDTGYHTVVGADPNADNVYEISVQVAGEATQTSLVLSVALMDEAGNVGPYQELEVELVRSGTGDVKITLSIDRLHDLDLHVIEPNGEEISYMNDASATGGKLDLDSGSRCEPSTANAENVFWPPSGAPAGEYVVSVHNFEQCSEGAIEYTVRVAYDNRETTYKGSFADGTAGEAVTADNVKEVVRFTRGVVSP